MSYEWHSALLNVVGFLSVAVGIGWLAGAAGLIIYGTILLVVDMLLEARIKPQLPKWITIPTRKEK